MKIFGFEVTREKRSATDAVVQTPNMGGVGLSWGSLFNNNNALGLSTVYRCVDYIANSVAVLPISVEDKTGTTVNHGLDYVWNDTSNKLTKFELIKMLVQSVLIKGNGFIYIERNGDGSVKSLRFLESSDVTINYNKNKNDLYYTAPTVTTKRIEPVNMIHIKLFSHDGVNGISILNLANRALKLANTTENSALNYFDSGMNISGVLTVQSSLSPQQIQDIKRTWSDTYVTGNGGIAVLQGNMDYKPVASNANEAQLLENRNYSVEDICRWFGINPVLLGMNNGSSLKDAQNEFVLHTLLPFVVAIEDEFTKKLLKPSEKNTFRINLEESYLLRVDKTNEATYYTTLTNNGVMSINEARERLGLKPVSGGDDLRIPYSDANQNKINQIDNE